LHWLRFRANSAPSRHAGVKMDRESEVGLEFSDFYVTREAPAHMCSSWRRLPLDALTVEVATQTH
jgi:hypothetical protein